MDVLNPTKQDRIVAKAREIFLSDPIHGYDRSARYIYNNLQKPKPPVRDYDRVTLELIKDILREHGVTI